MIDQVLIIAGITVLIMISPGPDMAIVLRNTLLGGRPAGLLTSLGILIGNLVHISYCVTGIGWLISQSILAFNVLKYAGALYLIYLGIVSIRSGANAEALDHPGGNRFDRGWLLQGFLNNILNPKGTLFYLGVFTVVITPETPTRVALLLILVTLSISAAFWLIFVLTLDHPAVRKVIDRFQAGVRRLFGGLLVLLGLRVALLDR